MWSFLKKKQEEQKPVQMCSFNFQGNWFHYYGTIVGFYPTKFILRFPQIGDELKELSQHIVGLGTLNGHALVFAFDKDVNLVAKNIYTGQESPFWLIASEKLVLGEDFYEVREVSKDADKGLSVCQTECNNASISQVEEK